MLYSWLFACWGYAGTCVISISCVLTWSIPRHLLVPRLHITRCMAYVLNLFSLFSLAHYCFHKTSMHQHRKVGDRLCTAA